MLLEVQHLKKKFPLSKNFFGKPTEWLHAVDDVSFAVEVGETLGFVGESGCGKTTLGLMLVKLLEPDEGSIIFEGHDLTKISNSQMKPYRRRIQMVFQDPYASLNPRMSVRDVLEEPFIVHKIGDSDFRKKRVHELLKMVDLSTDFEGRFPHEFSGGQRQRIVIARALALNPDLIIADEPVSSLDVSIQANILMLMQKLQKELGLAYIFISHDLRVVSQICDRVAVMNHGKIVELLNVRDLGSANHEYTKELLAAVPTMNPKLRKRARSKFDAEVTIS